MFRELGRLIGWIIAAVYGPGWLLTYWIGEWISDRKEERGKDHG